jgi:hypothetical protein
MPRPPLAETLSPQLQAVTWCWRSGPASTKPHRRSETLQSPLFLELLLGSPPAGIPDPARATALRQTLLSSLGGTGRTTDADAAAPPLLRLCPPTSTRRPVAAVL